MTNRNRVNEARRTIEEVSRDLAIGPAPFDMLNRAADLIADAMQFALDHDETEELHARAKVNA